MKKKRQNVQSPLGFGKKYFTFSSILAHTVLCKLQSQTARTLSLVNKRTALENDEIEDEDPPEILELLNTLDNKSCHCNCFFNLKARLALLINLYIPRCPYYTTYFAFRRSGVHPPFLSL